MEYNITEYISLFFIYGFLGWCSEVVFAALNDGKFVNRGFLSGPICPIYGFGLVLVIMLLEPLKDNILVLFTGSVIITTLLELAVGILAEIALDQRLWDYSNEPFNFKGLICLKFSIIWGIGAMMIVCIFHPMIIGLVRRLPEWLIYVMVSISAAVIAVDTAFTAMEAARIPRKKRAAREIERIICELSDGIGENISGHAIKLRGKYDELKKQREILNENQGAQSGRFMKAFPHINRSGYAEKLEKARKRCDEFIKKHLEDRR